MYAFTSCSLCVLLRIPVYVFTEVCLSEYFYVFVIMLSLRVIFLCGLTYSCVCFHYGWSLCTLTYLCVCFTNGGLSLSVL